MSSTAEGKKSKRRKSKKSSFPAKDNNKNNNNNNNSCNIHGNNGVNPLIDAANGMKSTEDENRAGSDHSVIVSEVEHLMLNSVNEDNSCPLPSSHVHSRSSNPYFSGNKCLVCRKDKTIEVLSNQVTNQDTCEHLEMFPLGHFSRLPLWICAECRCSIEDDHGQQIDYLPPTTMANEISLRETSSSPNQPYISPVQSSQKEDEEEEEEEEEEDGAVSISPNAVLCECTACQERRELESEREREALVLHQSWTELREAIRNVYHGEGLVSLSKEKTQGVSPSIENLEEVVHRLCVWDSHQFFLWLESYGRELVIEIKLNLLKYLGTGFSNSHQAKLFVTFMLEDYALLCSACKKLRPLIKELEQGHLKKFNLSWELVNRHLFQSMVYGDHQIQNALPGLITQLRLIRSNDEDVQKQLTLLLKKYIQFNEEMMIIAVIWREAEPLIQEFSLDLATLKVRRRIRLEDWEVIKKMKRKLITEQEPSKKVESSVHRCRCENCNQKTKCSCTFYSSGDFVGTQRNSAGRQCAFSNDIPESLDGLIYDGMFSRHDHKDHCHSLENVENGRSEGLKSVLEDVWSRNLAPIKECHGVQCHHEFGENDRRIEHSKDVRLRRNDNGAANHSCGSGLNGCQYNLRNNLTPTSSSNLTSVGNANVTSSVDLPTVDLPCECHACIQNADNATIPAIFNALPPRPATLHLYPHIHGPNMGHSLHNNNNNNNNSTTSSHCLKPVFHSNLNGVHLPSVSPCFKFGSANQDSMAAHGSGSSAPQDKSPTGHFYPDWDSPHKNGSKGMFGAWRDGGGDGFGSSVQPRNHHHDDLNGDGCRKNHEDRHQQDDMSSADLSQTVVKNDANAVHFNKATQVIGTNVAGSTSGHSAHDCCHSKLHSHDVFPHKHAPDIIGCCDTNNHASMHGTSAFGVVSSTGKPATSHQACGMAGSHVAQLCCGPASKRPCESDSEPRNNLSSAQSQANSSSLCSNPAVDNFTCDLEESVDDSCSEKSSSTSTSNQRDGKHCDCCYCEVFGHDVAAFAPMSRNYTEMRDKLRLRLNKKKMECMNEVNVGIAKKEEKSEDCRNLDDLINFINGGRDDSRNGGGGSGGDTDVSSKLIGVKPLKKAHKKQKRVDGKGKDEVSSKCNGNIAKDTSNDVTEAAKNLVVQAHHVSVIREVPRVAAVASPALENTAAVDRSKSKGGGGVIGKEALNQQSKCHEKAPKHSESKDAKLLARACERSVPFVERRNSDCWPEEREANVAAGVPSANNMWEMMNGTCHLLDKMSRKKRKASQPVTPALSSTVSSPNGSTSSSSHNSSKASPLISRHSKDIRMSSPRARSESKETIGCSLPVTMNGGGKCGKVQSLSRTSPIGTIRCNGSEDVDSKPNSKPAATNNKVEVMLRNGSSDDSAVPSSKNRIRKDERRKSDSLQQFVLTSSSPDHSIKNGGSLATKLNGRVQCCLLAGDNGSSKNSVKVKRNKKKNEKSTTIDDVFVPRDIDLDNVELDETERELEAFKRFCWNSVPVANKEKIHVNLKDIVVRKKSMFEL